MGIEDCSWSAIDVLNVVDGAELVIVERQKYLCVWHGGRFVEFYDLTSTELPDTHTISLGVPLTLLSVHDAIDDYFDALDFDMSVDLRDELSSLSRRPPPATDRTETQE